MTIHSRVLRVSHIDEGIGPTVNVSILAEVLRKKATHLSLHANKLRSLELPLPAAYISKNKEEEAIRKGATLEHLTELDLSSNCLNAEYSIPQVSGPKRVSLLGLAVNLCCLKLSSNGLTEKIYEALITSNIPRLHTLDISNNNFSMLPPELHITSPSLRHLGANNNQIKSLTTLLQVLHKLRGKIESVNFSNNPVCSKDLYHEKVLFVLGSSLVRFDNSKINASDREKARAHLENGLSNRSIKKSADASSISRREHMQSSSQENTSHLEQTISSPLHQTGGRSHQPREHANREAEVQMVDHRQYLESIADTENIKRLEEKVAALSALVEKQAHGMANQDGQNNDSKEYVHSSRDTNSNSEKQPPKPAVETDQRRPSRVKEKQSNKADMQRRKATAITMLKMILARKSHDRTGLRLAFKLWMLTTQLSQCYNKFKAKLIESETRWKAKSSKLVNEALSKEMAKEKVKFGMSEKIVQSSKETILQLKRKVKDLEQLVETERKSRISAEESSKRASDMLKANMKQLETTLRVDGEKHGERVRNAEAEVERLREERNCAKDALDKERNTRIELETTASQFSTANDEQKKELVNTHAAQLNQLKLEVLQKDDTIQRLKKSFEAAARRSAADTRRCEQALASENEAKDLLRTQTHKLLNVEAETERLRQDHKSKQAIIKTEMNSYASKASTLMNELEDKERKISSCERRMKSISEERDDIQKQLSECNRNRCQLKERNSQLQTQLDTVLRGSIDKERYDAEISRTMNLQRALDALRQSADRQQLELQSKSREMHRDNMQLRDDASTYEKQITALSKKLQLARNEWKSRQKHLENSHGKEMQSLRGENDQLLSDLNNKFEAERTMRLAIQRKAATLEAENEKQKSKMQQAIQGLANQLSGT